MVIAILLVFGVCLGSFVNALVWRLHMQAKSKKGKGAKANQYSILTGRSVCPNCKHQLASKDLIPIVSWLSLGGKCRYCGQPISWQYPLVEALTAFLFVFSYTFWPYAFTSKGLALFLFWLAFLVGFMALAVYDLRWFLLPNKIIRPLVGLALVQAGILLIIGPTIHQLISILVSVAIGGGIFYAIFQISNGKWIGGGDVKLGFLLGLVLADGGLMVLTIFTASLLGTFISLPLMATGKANRQTRIPFGPFLIAGAIVARLFGSALIHWYRTKLLHSV